MVTGAYRKLIDDKPAWPIALSCSRSAGPFFSEVLVPAHRSDGAAKTTFSSPPADVNAGDESFAHRHCTNWEPCWQRRTPVRRRYYTRGVSDYRQSRPSAPFNHSETTFRAQPACSTLCPIGFISLRPSEFLVLPWAQWGVSSHEPICPAPESNYDTLDAIVGEVAALFPSPYFHVGTDEVQVFDSWNTSAEVAALKAQEGLSNNSQLQAYFAKRMEGIVNARGKTLVAWGEARFHSNALPPALSDLSLDDDSVTMYWADPGDNEQMFQFPYVLTPWTHLYYDIVGNGQTAIQYGFDRSRTSRHVSAAGNAQERANLWGIRVDVDPRRSLPARAGRRPVRLPFSLRDVRSRVDGSGKPQPWRFPDAPPSPRTETGRPQRQVLRPVCQRRRARRALAL